MSDSGKAQPPMLNYARPPARKATVFRALLSVALWLLLVVVGAWVGVLVLVGFAVAWSRSQ